MTSTLDPALVLESGLLIGADWVRDSDGGTMDHINPATGRVQKAFAIASVGEVEAAVAEARAALPAWKRWQPDARRDVLLRLATLIADNTAEFATVAALEHGSLYSEAYGRYVAEWFRYYAGWADKVVGESVHPYPYTGLDFTLPEPVGVVGLIITWNGPLSFCAMGGAPALAAGCTLVIKSPDLAPFSAVAFGRLCLEAGIPPGVVNVVTGGPEVGNALVSSPNVDKICFTGGTATARKIQAACAATLKPMVAELGGKSANIVFADADLDLAITLSSRITNNAGQGCTQPTRLLVERSIYERVVEAVVARVEQEVIGDPMDPKVTMGPVISEAAVRRILGFIDRCVSSGQGKLLTGGHRIGGDLAEGFFLAPAVLLDVDNRSEIAQNEIFGPVLCAMPFDDEDEAIHLANDTTYGLAAYAQTTDVRRARRMARELEAGNVHINGTGPLLSPAAPFGGRNQSGVGRQGGRLGIYEFLDIKNVFMNV